MAMTSKQIYESAHSLIKEAIAKGLTPANPIRLELLGSYMQGEIVAPRRTFVISYIQPVFPLNEIEVWLNPIGFVFSISDMASQNWMQVFEHRDLFAVTPPSYSNVASSSLMKAVVQRRSDIAALDVSNLGDKSLIYVENDKAVWEYDAQATESFSATIIVPASGLGRWRLLPAASGVIVSF